MEKLVGNLPQELAMVVLEYAQADHVSFRKIDNGKADIGVLMLMKIINPLVLYLRIQDLINLLMRSSHPQG